VYLRSNIATWRIVEVVNFFVVYYVFFLLSTKFFVDNY